jgi:hypothetical protein
MDLPRPISTLETYRVCMKCIELTTRTYNFKNLAVGSCVRIKNSSLGNWILARNFLKKLFQPLFLRVDCSQSQDASIKPSCRIYSQRTKVFMALRMIYRTQWVERQDFVELGALELNWAFYSGRPGESKVLDCWFEQNWISWYKSQISCF